MTNQNTEAVARERESVRMSDWVGALRREIAAGLRAARRQVRNCHREKLWNAWSHRKGEVAALRGVARLLRKEVRLPTSSATAALGGNKCNQSGPPPFAGARG